MDLEKLIQTVSDAGAYLRQNALEHQDVEWKKTDDPVTALDRYVELYIKERMQPANFIGEEYGFEDNGAETTYIIDPIDGTKSFVMGDFNSSISVAVEQDEALVVGCIYDFMRDIMYVSCNNEAYMMCRGEKLCIPNKPRLRTLKINVEYFEEDPFKGNDSISSVTRSGSIALNMAQLGTGNFDGMIHNNTKKGGPWDVAAGYHFLKTLNYHITDVDGNPFDHRNRNGLIALPEHLAPMILPKLAPFLERMDSYI